MPFPVNMDKIVMVIAALVLVASVGSCVYNAGKTESENEALRDNAVARDGADGADDRVSDCPPGMFDFRTGRCNRT